MHMLVPNNGRKGCQTAKKRGTNCISVICQKLKFKISSYIVEVGGLMCCSGSNSLPSLICSNTVKQVSSGRQVKHFKPQTAKVYLWICCKHAGTSPTKKLYERSILVSWDSWHNPVWSEVLADSLKEGIQAQVVVHMPHTSWCLNRRLLLRFWSSQFDHCFMCPIQSFSSSHRQLIKFKLHACTVNDQVWQHALSAIDANFLTNCNIPF